MMIIEVRGLIDDLHGFCQMVTHPVIKLAQQSLT